MLDRAPVLDRGVSVQGANSVRVDSQTSWDMILAHRDIVAGQLDIGTPDQFIVDEYALQCRVASLTASMGAAHITSRGIHQVAVNLHSTVKKVEGEFKKARVLDIGCGEGKLGAELERKAKAHVTYLDKDEDSVKAIQTRRGAKYVEDATRLPFKDGEFTRTIGLYAAHVWTADPVDSLVALLEQLRVTTQGGTAFTIPLFNNILMRQDVLAHRDMARWSGQETEESQKPSAIAQKVWDIRDYLVANALSLLAEEGYIDMTWASFIGNGATANRQLETYSGILDIKKQLDKDLISDLTSGAEELVYSPTASNKAIIENVLDLPTSELGVVQNDYEIWEGGLEGAGFKITRHNLPGVGTPFIAMSVSGREPAMTNLIARFTRALGEYTTIEPGRSTDDPTMVTWVLDPEIERMLK